MNIMTEKLFERDSNLKTCEATVLECEQAPQGFAVVLDRTVLFPEGGGQLSDTGTINGAAVKRRKKLSMSAQLSFLWAARLRCR